eukprot:UN04140
MHVSKKTQRCFCFFLPSKRKLIKNVIILLFSFLLIILSSSPTHTHKKII